MSSILLLILIQNSGSLKKVKHIAIDEIYKGKKLGYQTVVIDLLNGSVIYTAAGKKGSSLDAFWKRLKHSGTNIEALATNMGMAYVSAVQAHLPNAVLVVDHFHVVKRFQEKLTQLRCALFRQTEDEQQKNTLKETRWFLLKNKENLNPEKNEASRLNEALALNEPLAKAYYMKESLQQIWKQSNKEDARKCLDQWVRDAAGSEVKILESYSKTVSKFRENRLAYYDFNSMSSGPMEGVNNRIKAMVRQAFGYRDQEFYELKIKASHEAKDGFS